eukprot:GSChrysophyteH2.ASY1.ANO1.1622.1 assembled CDS
MSPRPGPTPGEDATGVAFVPLKADDVAVDVEVPRERSKTVTSKDKKVIADFYRSFEYTMVFPMMGDEDDAKFDPNDRDNAMQSKTSRIVINSMLAGGFEVYTYLSVQKDELYCLFTAPQNVLADFADNINFNMPLDDIYCKTQLAQGSIIHKYKPIKIADETRFSELHPFDFLYGKYGKSVDQKIYARTGGGSGDDDVDDIFTGSLKLKLMYNMLVASKRDGGCKLDIQGMLLRNEILALYPSHNESDIHAIMTEVESSCLTMPWNYPFELLRNYFGEKFGLIFVFIGEQSKLLILPVIIGFIVQMIVWSTGPNYSHPILPFFGMFSCMWAMAWINFWESKSAYTAMQWGQTGFEKSELERPQFKGDLITSPVTGQFELWYPPHMKRMKRLKGIIVIIFTIALVLGTVTGIYVMRFALEKDYGSNAATIASFATTVQIAIYNKIYTSLAIGLNDMENHKTDTQYQDSLIAKTFVFQFVNSYVSFFYVGFIAPYIPSSAETNPEHKGYLGQCGYFNCMMPMSNNLAIIYASRLTSNNIIDVALEWYAYRSKLQAEMEGITADVIMTPPEEQYVLLKTDAMQDSIGIFADMAIQFGFSILFVVALPICFFFTFLSNAVRSRLIVRKYLEWHQRPIPNSCEDIGTWTDIFSFISYAAVFTNGALICFTMDVLKTDSEVNEQYLYDTSNSLKFARANLSSIGRVWVYFGFVMTVIFAQFLISYAIESSPYTVDLQLERNKFITDKLIDHIEDDDFNEDDDDNEDDLNILAESMEANEDGGQLNSRFCALDCFGDSGSPSGRRLKKVSAHLEQFPVFATPKYADDIKPSLNFENYQATTKKRN